MTISAAGLALVALGLLIALLLVIGAAIALYLRTRDEMTRVTTLVEVIAERQRLAHHYLQQRDLKTSDELLGEAERLRAHLMEMVG